MNNVTQLAGIALLALAVSACGGGGGNGSGEIDGPVAPTPNKPTQPSGSGTGSSAVPPNNASFGVLLNGVRADHGQGSLAFDSRLADAAQRHSDDMAENDFFGHVGSDGTRVGKRATDAGYKWKYIGENLAKGPVGMTNQMAMDGWMNSPSHRATNLDPDYKDFGLAKARDDGEEYWTLVFGTKAQNSK